MPAYVLFSMQIMLRCRLSRRQAQLYAALRKNLTLQDLVAMGARAGGGAGGGGAASSRLMGLIMQMRKVRRGGCMAGWLYLPGCWTQQGGLK